MRFIIPILIVVASGCSSKSRVTEEDRIVLDHVIQISDLQLAQLLAVTSGNPLNVNEFIQLISDAKAGSGQLQENWGKPKDPVPYSPEAARVAREKSKGSHSVGFWGMALGALFTGGGVALGIARKFGGLIPGFGPVFTALDSVILGAEKMMAKLKAGGKPELAEDFAKALSSAQENLKVKAFIESKLEGVKEKYKVDLVGILKPPATSNPA